MTNEQKIQAQVDKMARKQLLTMYRDLELHTILSSYDEDAMVSSSVLVCGVGWQQLQPMGVLYKMLPFAGTSMAVMNRNFRIWACIRVSGKWPWFLLEGSETKDWLPGACPCGHQWPSISHSLLECRLAENLYKQLFFGSPAPRFTDQAGVTHCLFGWETEGPLHHLSVRYVGELIWTSMRHTFSRELNDSEQTTINDFLELARQAARR